MTQKEYRELSKSFFGNREKEINQKFKELLKIHNDKKKGGLK